MKGTTPYAREAKRHIPEQIRHHKYDTKNNIQTSALAGQAAKPRHSLSFDER